MLSREVFKTLTSLHTAKYQTITGDEVQHDISIRTGEAGYIPAAIRQENAKVTMQSEKWRIKKKGDDQKSNYFVWAKSFF